VSVDPLYFGVTGFVFPTPTATADYPAVGDVAYGVAYNFGALIGTRRDALESDVRQGVGYGSGHVGTLIVLLPVAPVSSSRYTCDEAIRTRILQLTAVADLVGNRLHADVAPQTPVYPYGTITLIGDAERSKRLNDDAMGTIKARYQIDWYAKKKSEARALATAVSARASNGGLDGFRGAIGTGDTAAFVQSAKIENRRDDHDEPQSSGEGRIYQCGFDAVIVFNE